MTQHLLPVLYTLFVWWFSTGVILYLDGLPRWTYKWSMLAATVLAAIAFVGVVVTAHDTRATGAYLAFTCTIVIWGWKEMAFLMGYVTGPRRTPLPAGTRGWRRAGYALQTIVWHELALIALGVAVVALTWGAPNAVAACTYTTLWVMRLSAKLNVFLGVRNLNEAFLPEHLRYLGSYFRRRTMNVLFPLSLIGSAALAIAVWEHALADTTRPFGATASTFVAMLLTLALLEHVFMMLPLPTERLWGWGMRSRESDAAAVASVDAAR